MHLLQQKAVLGSSELDLGAPTLQPLRKTVLHDCAFSLPPLPPPTLSLRKKIKQELQGQVPSLQAPPGLQGNSKNAVPGPSLRSALSVSRIQEGPVALCPTNWPPP